jgi:programmed cell death 6-interacting protein
MVESVVSQGLLEPKKSLGSDNLIFGNLISWGAQTAIGRCGSPCAPIIHSFIFFSEIYNDRRNTTIKEYIKDRTQQLNDGCTRSDIHGCYRSSFNCCFRELQSLNLPAALDALDKPIGLPPSLLKKAEEVRSENGPERVEKSLEDIEILARRAMSILTEVCARHHWSPS